MSHALVSRQHGLEWVEQPFVLQPRWTVETCVYNIETLVRQRIHLQEDAICCVTFFNLGGFNKLNQVELGTGTYVMRVALPVDPHYKTASEVATMEYIHEHTHIAVPLVRGHGSSNQNIIGFEWILMSFGPTNTLKSLWRSLSMADKHSIVKSLAEFQVHLFDCSFQGIGNIYNTSGSFELGQIVAVTLFCCDRGQRQLHRRPFRNSFDWLQTRLDLIREEQAQIIESADEEGVLEDARTSHSLAEQLLGILPSIFNQDASHERSIIFHDDLSTSNILIDDSKRPVIIDWECVSALPMRKACHFPSFLGGRVCTELPTAVQTEQEGDLYTDQVLEYERWQLRCTFETKMEQLRPQWITEHRKGYLQRDFECCPQM